MDDKVLHLQGLLASLIEEQDSILEKAKLEDREQNDEEVDQLEALNAKVGETQALIDREERRKDVLEATLATRKALTTPKPVDPDPDLGGLPGKAVTSSIRESVRDDPKLGWRNLGEFANGVRQAYTHGSLALDRRLVIGAAIQGMTTKVGKDGGFAVPTAFSTAIWDEASLEGADNLMAQADNYMVEGGKLSFLANAETSRVNGSRYGGIRGYWIDEGGTLTATGPEVRKLEIEPKKLAILAYMTSELLEQNASALDQYLTRAAGSEIRFMVGDAMVSGNGTGKPRGIVGADGTVSVAKQSGQATATIKFPNINKMWGRCHPRARQGSVWYINIDCEEQLQNLEQPVGTGGVPAYMPPGGISAAPYATLKGRPVVPIEFCSTVGTVGDIILANWAWYALGTRGGVRSDTSIHVQFLTDQTAFRFIFAADGQPWLASAITPYKGSNSLSPFVTLATRS